MINVLKAFLKKQTTIIGFATALIFQILFSVIWLTGYDNINARIDQFRIGIINEDAELGKEIAGNLKKNLPFNVDLLEEKAEAMEKLEQREIQLLIHIPTDFSTMVGDPLQKGKIVFSVNESNSTMIKTSMQSVIDQVTASLNQQSIEKGLQFTFQQGNLPVEAIQGMSQGLSERVVADVQNIHEVENFSHLMVPMLLLMASFTGSMLMAMELNKSSKALENEFGKWSRFTARGIINVIGAILISLVGTIMVNSLGVHSSEGFLTMWFFECLYVLTFLAVAQIAFYFVGDAGAWFNIALLSIQLLTSGATIPRELLSPFYLKLSYFLPGTYTVDGMMNLVLGGPGIADDVIALLIILVVSVVIVTLRVAVQKETVRVKDAHVLATKPEAFI